MAVSARDKRGYAGPDSGCYSATAFLGEQSNCLACPFYPKPCVLEVKGETGGRISLGARDLRIKQLYEGGKTVADIARLLNVKQRVIRRVLGIAQW